jgi:hypothetical protein
LRKTIIEQAKHAIADVFESFIYSDVRNTYYSINSSIYIFIKEFQSKIHAYNLPVGYELKLTGKLFVLRLLIPGSIHPRHHL